MRLLTGAGTPRELHARTSIYLFGLITSDAVLLFIIVIAEGNLVPLAAFAFASDPIS